MRLFLVLLFLSVILAVAFAQDSSEESEAPKRVLKKYRVRRPVVVDGEGNVVRAGPRLRRVRVKNPRPEATPSSPAPPVVSVTVSSSTPLPTPAALQQSRIQSQTSSPRGQFSQQQVFYEDQQQIVEPVRTVPTYRQATPTASRQALLSQVNYKSRGTISDDPDDRRNVGTTRNYSHINEDGSFTFGYEGEDGSFKEETRGTDCVVRGKYGYVDPDGVRREFTYVSGNPCDPNDPNKEEEQQLQDDEDEQAAPRPILRKRVRPADINANNLQGLEQTVEEKLPEDQLAALVRPTPRQRIRFNSPQQQVNSILPSFTPTTYRPSRIRITSAPPTVSPTESVESVSPQSPQYIIRQRPFARRPVNIQEPDQSLEDQAPERGSDRGRSLFNFEQEIQRIARPANQPQPLYEQPLQLVQQHHSPSFSQRQVFGGPAFHQQQRQIHQHQQSHQQQQQPLPIETSAQTPTAGPVPQQQQRNPAFGRYRTELVYDPANGQYTSVLVQSMPHSNQEIELTQKLRAFVEPQKPESVQVQQYDQPRIQFFRQQQPQQQQQQQNQQNQQQPSSAPGTATVAQYYQRPNQGVYQAQPQVSVTNLQFIPPHLRPQSFQPQQIQQQSQPQQQYTQQQNNPSHAQSAASGQIDAFLRTLNIAI
jgi:hypothetical protein